MCEIRNGGCDPEAPFHCGKTAPTRDAAAVSGVFMHNSTQANFQDPIASRDAIRHALTFLDGSSM
jgi:hypothetical protein